MSFVTCQGAEKVFFLLEKILAKKAWATICALVFWHCWFCVGKSKSFWRFTGKYFELNCCFSSFRLSDMLLHGKNELFGNENAFISENKAITLSAIPQNFLHRVCFLLNKGLFCLFFRLFGTTGYCAACNKVIPAFEMVMRARTNVYHLECFACQQCNHR